MTIYLTLVVCLSTNGERALNHTIVKRLILTTKTQATKIKSEFFNYVYTVKGIQCHGNRFLQLFELKKKQQIKSRYLNFFFV